MIHSPPAVPASQNAAQLAGSKGTPNQNYVRVTNGNTLNDKPVVHRKRAIHLVKCGRAEWIVVDRQIKLIAHSQNRALEAKAGDGYDQAGEFEPYRGQSDGFSMYKARRASRSVSATISGKAII